MPGWNRPTRAGQTEFIEAAGKPWANLTRSVSSNELVRSLLAATAGALAYGGWALFVNHGAGWDIGATTAAVQASYSFFLTLFITLFVEFLQRRLGRTLAALAAAVLIASATMFCIAFALQSLAGSLHVLATILPGWVIGSAYVTAYATTRHLGAGSARNARAPGG